MSSTATATVTGTLQEFADQIVAQQYRQPLKTVREACDSVGWQFEDKPKCCGVEVTMWSMFGDAYLAQCDTCGKFIVDVTGPSFSQSGSSVQFIDKDAFPDDTEWSRCWIAGQEPRP